MLINSDGVDLALTGSEIRARAEEMGFERDVVHTICEFGLTRDEVSMTPGVDSVRCTNGQDLVEVFGDSMLFREIEELLIQGGRSHCKLGIL